MSPKLLERLERHPLLARWPIVKQFVKFSVVGVVNTLTSFSIYLVATRLGHIAPLVANALAFVVAVTVSFGLNKYWTFRDRRRAYVRQYSLFFAINIVGLILSEAIIALLHHLLRWSDLLAFFSAVLVVMFWNFGANYAWTFRPVPQ